MVIRMRHTRAHTANRRSHHAITKPRLSKCGDCGAAYLRHNACGTCGKYRGRVVVNVTKRAERAAKKKAAHAHEHKGASKASK